MDQTLLVTKNWIEDGRRLLEQLVQSGFDVEVAGWIRFSDDSDWSLFIASKVVDDQGQFRAYRIIDDMLQTWSNPWISILDIGLLRTASPLAVDMKRIRSHAVGGVVSRAYRGVLGDRSVDEAYIYVPISKVEEQPGAA